MYEAIARLFEQLQKLPPVPQLAIGVVLSVLGGGGLLLPARLGAAGGTISLLFLALGLGLIVLGVAGILRHPEYYFRPLPQQCHFHIAKQSDKSVVTHFVINFEISNRSNLPMRIAAVELRKPHPNFPDELHNVVNVSPTSLNRKFMDRHSTAIATVNIIVRGDLGSNKKELFVELRLILDPPNRARLRLMVPRLHA